MIRFGPSGIPLSCKGRTLRDGIEDVHNLGLTAMEVQLVRMNLEDRYASEDEEGLTPRSLPNGLVVQIVRRKGTKEQVISDLDERIEKGDLLYLLGGGIATNYEELNYLGKLAKELDVELSLHTPYYMDLAGEEELAQRSMDNIKFGGLIANEMDATVLVTHLGLYGSLTKKEAGRRIAERLRVLKRWYTENDLKPRLGVETSGRQEVFGSYEEILNLCKNIKGIIPVLNFAHIHSREKGSLKRKEDFQKVLDKAEKFVKGRYHTHFSGVEHEGGNELRYTPIKKGDLRFEPLAECILENNFYITVISSSPLLEHDAMYMKVILERVLAKKVVKSTKRKEEK